MRMHEVARFSGAFASAYHRSKSVRLIPSPDNIPKCRKSRRATPGKRAIDDVFFAAMPLVVKPELATV